MTQELFNRVAILRIGERVEGQPSSKALLNAAVFSGLRISFEIDKNSESHPNTTKVSIYNLSLENRTKLESTGIVMGLDVGYAGLGDFDPIVSQIFIGDVKRVKSERKGCDLITTLEAGDNEVALRETTIDQSFGDQTPLSTVIGAVAETFKVAIGYMAPGLAGVYQNGITLSGLASDNLDVLTKKAGLEWSVTDGELFILDPKQPTPETAVVVSPQTGLLGIPSKREQGIEFTALINPEIKPGRAIALSSGPISGVFRARTCKYQGDTHSGQWTVTVEAV